MGWKNLHCTIYNIKWKSIKITPMYRQFHFDHYNIKRITRRMLQVHIYSQLCNKHISDHVLIYRFIAILSHSTKRFGIFVLNEELIIILAPNIFVWNWLIIAIKWLWLHYKNNHLLLRYQFRFRDNINYSFISSVYDPLVHIETSCEKPMPKTSGELFWIWKLPSIRALCVF